MAIKMIVSDLDGTMLNAAHKIPAANIEAVREAQEKGVIVTFATGRMYSSARPYAEELGITAPLITYNGAVVKTVAGELISGSFMEEETVRAVLEYCFARDIYIQLYSDGEFYYVLQTEKAKAYEAAAGIKGHAVGREGMLSRTKHVEKMLIVGQTPEMSDDIVIDLNVKFSADIVAMKSTEVYIEVIRPSVSKAGAMLALAERYGIAPAEIMALGDSDNDISMLKAAGLAIAMGNANETVREMADYVTVSGEAGGVAEAINKYVLKKESS